MQAAIFDLDGLLIDSEPLWRRAEREVFGSVGLTLSENDCRRTTGLRADKVVEFWFARHPWQGASVSTVLTRLEQRVVELIRSDGAAMPGVHRALKMLRDAGLRLALASSSSHEIIRAALAALRLAGVFEVIASGADDEACKPDPAIYLRTVRALGLAAADCVAFEDSTAGVRAAFAAGCFTVAVPDPADFANPAYDIAHRKLPSLESFDLRLLDRTPLIGS